MPKPNPWVRVLDKDTGHKQSVRTSALPHGNYQRLKEDDAVGADGEPLPPEYATAKTRAVSSTTTEGRKANDTKEKSDG